MTTPHVMTERQWNEAMGEVPWWRTYKLISNSEMQHGDLVTACRAALQPYSVGTGQMPVRVTTEDAVSSLHSWLLVPGYML